jgi:hypothetical protein
MAQDLLRPEVDRVACEVLDNFRAVETNSLEAPMALANG